MKRIPTTLMACALTFAVVACDTETEEVDTEFAGEEAPLAEPTVEPPAAPSLTLQVDSLEELGAYVTDGQGRALYLLEEDEEGQSTCYDACAEAWPPLLASQDMQHPATGQATPPTGTEQQPPAGDTARGTGTAQHPDTGQPGGAHGVSVQGSGLDQSLVGTIQRRDGQTQITYNGHPLYYYARDTRGQRPMGHHIEDEWGEWYLVTPDGEKLEEGEERDATEL